MQYIADLHLHSRYSRATARNLDIAGLYKGAQIKGINIIGSGDFTHPQYIKEIEKELASIGAGLYKFKRAGEIKTEVKDAKEPVFVITTEISNIYKRHAKVRRVHTCVWAPGLAEVKELNRQLAKIGNIASDGRPILGMDVADMAKLIWKVSDDFIIIPAHAWTPWFAVFGSKSGFDSLEECFGDLTPRIHAIETGLSSDPAMNWRLSQLDNISLVSNSDAHSLPNLGREATVFELEKLSIKNIQQALIRHPERKRVLAPQSKDLVAHRTEHEILRSAQNDERKNKINYTIEFYPEEGKYHYDGHRECKIVFKPEETKKHKGICPVCKRPLTLGVDYRVSELADRSKPKKLGEFRSIVPLAEIIADAFAQNKNTKKVQFTYSAMIKELGNEFFILLDAPLALIEKFGIPEIAEGIRRVREGELQIAPGYDGEYGVVKVFSPEEQISARSKQRQLF